MLELNESCLVMSLLYLGVGRNIDHGGVLYLVDGMVPDHAHLSPLGDQDNVETF